MTHSQDKGALPVLVQALFAAACPVKSSSPDDFRAEGATWPPTAAEPAKHADVSISTTRPVQDYKREKEMHCKSTEHQENGPRCGTCSFMRQTLSRVIKDIAESASPERWRDAIDAVQLLREECIAVGNPGIFNGCVESLQQISVGKPGDGIWYGHP